MTSASPSNPTRPCEKGRTKCPALSICMPSGFVADQRVHPQWLNHRFNRLPADGHIGCEDNPRQVARQDQVRFPHEPLQYLLIRAAHNPGTRYENRPLLKNGRLSRILYPPLPFASSASSSAQVGFPSAITPTTTSGAGLRESCGRPSARTTAISVRSSQSHRRGKPSKRRILNPHIHRQL